MSHISDSNIELLINSGVISRQYYNKAKVNYQMSVDIGKEDASTTIKCFNGVKIIIDKNNINDFIIGDDEVSKVVEILKREMILNNISNEDNNNVSDKIGNNKDNKVNKGVRDMVGNEN